MTERLDKLISDSGLYSRSEARTLVRAAGSAWTARPSRPRSASSRARPPSAWTARPSTAPDTATLCSTSPRDTSAPPRTAASRPCSSCCPRNTAGLGLFPVGRLDRDTTGLLLLTNDGDYAHRVISPKSKVEKCYLASTEGQVTAEDVSAFARGPHARGWNTMPARETRAAGGRALPRARHGGQVPPG